MASPAGKIGSRPPAPDKHAGGLMREPRSILLTGASSGIGAALARAYAGPGIRLVLGGRDAGRLGEVATACRAAGAEVEQARVGVADRQATAEWLLAVDSRRPLDLVIANAGISAGTADGSET